MFLAAIGRGRHAEIRQLILIIIEGVRSLLGIPALNGLCASCKKEANQHGGEESFIQRHRLMIAKLYV